MGRCDCVSPAVPTPRRGETRITRQAGVDVARGSRLPHHGSSLRPSANQYRLSHSVTAPLSKSTAITTSDNFSRSYSKQDTWRFPSRDHSSSSLKCYSFLTVRSFAAFREPASAWKCPSQGTPLVSLHEPSIYYSLRLYISHIVSA